MLVIKNAHAFTPDDAGTVDIFVAGCQIAFIGANLAIPDRLVTATIDAKGLYAVPGFIDGHVHTIGGGGEGGFATRTPELKAGTALACGVTTVIGVLGTDGIARSMEALIAKTYGLRAEGLSAYCLSGSYRVPLTTLTGELVRDIMFIEPVLGAGEIAIGDHRSSWPSDEELTRVITDARLGGILSGKAGIVNIHLGDDNRGFKQLERIFSNMSVPLQQVLPTHCNRTPNVFKQALAWSKAGGYIDLTATETNDQLSAAAALSEYFNTVHTKASLCDKSDTARGGVTITSDAQGSLPRFNEQGECIGLGVGTNRALLQAVQHAVSDYGLPLDFVLKAVTSTPAMLYKLHRKGKLKEGLDADIVLLDDKLNIVTVIANGTIVVENGTLLKKGIFE